MWKQNIVFLTLVGILFQCHASKVPIDPAPQDTSCSSPGYDPASKTIRLQKCSSVGESNDTKIPMLLYDLSAHAKQTRVHRYYNETTFVYIVTYDSEAFTCPDGATEQVFNLTKNVKPPEYFLPNGYLRLYDDAGNSTRFFPPTLYCINSVSDDRVEGKACIPSETSTVPTIRRCTKAFPSFVYTLTYLRNNRSKPAVKVERLPDDNLDPWDIYRDSRFPLKECDIQLPLYFHKNLACKNPVYVVTDPAVTRTTAFAGLWYTDIRVTEDGKLEGRNSGSESWRPLQSIMHGDEFCIEKGYVTPPTSSDGQKIGKPEYQRYLQTCPQDNGTSSSTLANMNRYFILAGMLFLLVTLVTYALVWNQQTVHGKIAAGFVSSMFLVFLSQFLNSVNTFQYRSKGCAFNGIIQHFFTLAMYSWMAVMNFDVWQALTTVQHASQASCSKLLILYCFITYGSAGFVVLVSASLHYSHEIDTETIIHPQYGIWACYINYSVYNYYFLPLTLVAFTVSLCFSLMTCKTLYKWNKTRKKLTRTTQNSSLENWLLAVKVFVLTGISWGLTILSNAIHGLDDELPVEWWLIEVYNFLQAAALFWILVMKKDIRKQLCKNYRLAGRMFKFWDRQVAKVKGTPTAELTTSLSVVKRGSSREPSSGGSSQQPVSEMQSVVMETSG